MKNFLSSTVNKGDMRRLNYMYNKTVFGQGSAPDPAIGELTTLSQAPKSDEEGILPPIFPPLSPQD